MNTGDANESWSSRHGTGVPASLAGFLEMAFEAAVAFDLRERITYWNPAAEQLYGWTAQEALGKTAAELFRSGSRSQEQKQRKQRRLRLKRGETLRGRYHACRKDGSPVRVQYAARAVFDPAGKLSGYIATYRDISAEAQILGERKRAEEQLAQSSQKLNEILASIQDDFFVIDHDWIFVYANRHFTSKLGKEPEDLIGNNVWQMFPKHMGTNFEENLRAAMDKREVRRFEISGKYTDAWYRLTAFPSTEGITVLGTDITESKWAAAELQASQQTLETVVNHMPAAVTLIRGSDLRLQLINPAYQAIAPGKEMVGHTLDELWPETGQNFAALCRRVLETGEPYQVIDELNMIRRQPDGPLEPAYFSWSLYRVRLPGNSGWGLLNTSSETTVRKRAEQALAQALQELRMHLDNSPLAVISFDPEYRITEWSAGAERMFGWRAEEVLNKRIAELHWVYEEDAQRVAGLSEDMFAGRTPSNIHANRNYRKDGAVMECEWYNSALSDANGKLISVRSQVLDVTERNRTRQKIFESNQLLMALMNALPVGVSFSDDATAQHVTGNPAVLAQFEMGSQDNLSASAPDSSAPGRQVRFFRDGKQITDADLPLQRAVVENREIPPMELEVHLPSGRTWWASASGAPIRDENGNVIGGVAVTQDITAHKQAENTLREHQEQLQLLNETLEQKVREKTAQVHHVASDLIKAVQHERHRISHILHDDLQQRIYAIQMQLTFLNDEVQGKSESAQKEISDVQKQLAEVLEVTRHLSIDLSPPILRDEGLSHAISWLAAQMRQRYGLPIELQANGPFAVPDEALHVLMFNCVRELLFNVVKHAQARRAIVALHWAVDELQIEVRDDGKGFPVNVPEQQASEEMNEADASRPGLGLSTIRHQLSLFDGRMEIRSQPGAGARVTLIVPVPQGSGKS